MVRARGFTPYSSDVLDVIAVECSKQQSSPMYHGTRSDRFGRHTFHNFTCSLKLPVEEGKFSYTSGEVTTIKASDLKNVTIVANENRIEFKGKRKPFKCQFEHLGKLAYTRDFNTELRCFGGD